jgi:2-polyprenyl-3-methyl-5-hydroxy-6-metoxy-1,4-benzoquinol methylase
MAEDPPGAAPDERVGTYFDRAAVVWDTFYDQKRTRLMRWVDRKFRSDVFERYRRTFEELGDCTGKTLLDVGCGSGPYCVEAARRGCRRVLGLDMAGGMVELARARAKDLGVADRCEFRVGSFPQDAPEEVFDHIAAMGVMDYVADPVPFVAAMRKCARISAMTSVPSIHWFRTPLRRLRYRIKRCPVYFYRRDEVEAVYREGGFKHVKIAKMPGAGMDYFAIGRLAAPADRPETSTDCP